ncbi:hypothetical protein MKX01_029009, partial [Papaver californicum]
MFYITQRLTTFHVLVIISLHVPVTTSSILYPVFCMILNVVWLKLVSYAHTNYNMKALSKSSDKGDMSSNSSGTDNSYNINIKSGILHGGSYFVLSEWVLKLSVPTFYVWLHLFYCFFHLWFNILAEVLRFGERSTKIGGMQKRLK